MKKIKYLSLFIIVLTLLVIPHKVKADETIVATIGDDSYSSLIDALDALKEGQTVKLLADVSLVGEPLYVAELPKRTTLDLNGHNITVGWATNVGNLIFTGKDITIKNGSFSGSADYVLWIGDSPDTDNVLLESLILNGGANIFNSTNVFLRDVKATGKTYYAVWGDENSHITIESGYYKSPGVATLGFSETDSDMTILGGTFEIENALLLEGSPKSKFLIKDGSYNKDVEKYLSEKYESINENGIYIVRRKEVAKPDIDIDNPYESDAVIKNSLDEYKEIDTTGRNIETSIDVIEATPEEAVKQLIEEKIKETSLNIKIAQYFDISIHILDADSKEKIGLLTRLNQKINFEIVLPKKMLQVKNRKFYVIRKHDDKIDFLNTKVGEDGKTLTFESDLFSTYAVAYVDEEEIKNPNTYDGMNNYIIMTLISIIGMVATALYLKKEFFSNQK